MLALQSTNTTNETYTLPASFASQILSTFHSFRPSNPCKGVSTSLIRTEQWDRQYTLHHIVVT